AADVGGQKELVSDSCGILVPQVDYVTDANNYYSAISQLLSDPGLVKQMGDNARQRIVESFDLDLMVNQVETCFLNISALTQSDKDNESAYLMLLNKMMNLEKDHQELLELSDSKVGRFISKHKKSYKKVKQVYHNVKDILKKGI